MRVLLTGSTGFLGSYVTKELDNRGIFWKGISRAGEHGFSGNLKSWDLGVDIHQLKLQKFDAFIHMGALYDLRARPRDLRSSNVSGTLSALILARKLGISQFINLSSIAAVINTPNKDVGENEFFLKRSFPDVYAETKALAEQLVRQWSSFFDSTLNLRMGILVGDTSDGVILRTDGPYHIPEAFRKLKKLIYYSPFPIPLPGAGKEGAPLVPVDRAGFAIVEALEKSLSIKGLNTLHLVPEELAPIAELYDDSLNFFGLGHKSKKLFGNLPFEGESKLAEWFAQMPKEEVTYLMKMPRFHTHTTREFLPEDWCPSYATYKDAFWRGYEKFIQNR